MKKKSLSVFLCLTVILTIIAGCKQQEPVKNEVNKEKEPKEVALTTEVLFKETDDLTKIATQTYIWGYPLVSAANIRQNKTLSDPTVGRNGTPINSFGHAKQLADPSNRSGPGPNNDTMYSIAWIDLEDGPFVIETPDFGSRYYTFSINYSDSSADKSLGQRTHGGQMPPLFITGPNDEIPVPDGMEAVVSPTRYLLIAGRILVDGEKDLPKVHELQKQIKLRTFEDYTAGIDRQPLVSNQRLLNEGIKEGDDFTFLYQLGNVLKDWWVRDEEKALLDRFSAIGLTTVGFDPTVLSDKQKQEILHGLEQGKEFVNERSKNLGRNINGWTINNLGPRFGDDYLLRAAVAKDQIYVAIPEEAVYPIGRVDVNGDPLTGEKSYRIVLDKNTTPPVKAFWSITLYNDQGFMVENEIDRFSIGDRTEGLIIKEDGTIEIRIQKDKPSEVDVNWLPAPEGIFYFMMRLYIPEQQVIEGKWVPAPIVPMESK
ncbi:DUF1254 domain-containing protein [Neobacillus vireti]|uniref:DUF1254 domain-containing protein n=1 Tax=Neobacillus vireti TaxID=220686 RepID=UPI002FFFBC5D